MNVDIIVAYFIFLFVIGFSIYYLFNILPIFDENYMVEVSNYEKGISFFNLSGNYEVKKYVECIKLPGFFKSRDFVLNGRYVRSNISYTYDGYSITQNYTVRSEYNPPTVAYILGDYVCPNVLIEDVKNGTETKNQVFFEKEYWEGEYLFKEEIYKWY